MKGANRGIARRATQLILRNDGNACYMNSLVQVMLWLLECLQIRTLSSENDLESFFLSLMQSNDRTPLSLLHHPRWQSVMRNWGEAHRQHDVCESDCGLFAGLWKAFTPTMAGHTHLLDEGPCTQPIILHLPQATRDSTPPRIQRLVDEWHRDVLIAFMVCIRRRQLFYFNYIVLLVNEIGFTKIMPRFFLMILFEFQFYKQLGRQLTQSRTNVPSLNIMVTRRSRGTIPPIWCRIRSGAAMMNG